MQKRLLRTTTAVVVTGSVLLVVSGCSRTESRGLPNTPRELRHACIEGSYSGAQRAYYPDAAAVAGSTHPIALFVTDHLTNGRGNDYLDYSYQPYFSTGTRQTANLQTLQLIACAHHDVSDGGQTIGICHFDEPSSIDLPVVRSTITVLVFELKTGKQYAELEFVPNTFECPRATRTTKGSEHSKTLPALPSTEKYVAEITNAIPGAQVVN